VDRASELTRPSSFAQRLDQIAIASLVVIVSAAYGAATATRPLLAVGMILCAAAVVVVLVMPVRWLAPAAILGAASVPVLLLESRVRGLPLNGTPFTGQARLLICLLIVALIRSRHVRPRAARAVVIGAASYALILLFEVLVSAATNQVYSHMWADLYRQLAYMAALPIGVIAATAARERGELDAFLRTVAYAGTAAMCAAVAFWAWGRGLLPLPSAVTNVLEEARATQVYGTRISFPLLDDSPNLAAVAFVLVAAFVVPALSVSRRRTDRWMGFSCVAAAAGAVLVTGSRTGTIAFAAAAVVAIWMARKRTLKLTVIAVGAVVAVSAIVYSHFPASRAVSTQSDTLVARQAIWKQAAADVTAHPIVGSGYHFSARDKFVEPATGQGAAVARHASVHSEYLGVLVDGGVVAASFFSIFLVTCAHMGRRLSQRTARRADGVGAMAFLAALAVSMTVSASLQSAVVAIIVWLFLGVQSALVEDA
jgi:hypothetical protein